MGTRQGVAVARWVWLLGLAGAVATVVACTGTGPGGDDPPAEVRLLPDNTTSTEVVVPPGGQVDPVLEVTAEGVPVLLSVTTGREDLVGGTLALLPGDAGDETPVIGFGTDDSAWWTRVPAEPAWLFIAEPEADTYRLMVADDLAGATLTLAVHPAVVPSRDDLLGSWQYVDADRFLHLTDDGDLRIDSEHTEVGGGGTWEYSAGELRWTFEGDDATQTRHATLLPDGQLGLAIHLVPPDPAETPLEGMEPMTLRGAMAVYRPVDR